MSLTQTALKDATFLDFFFATHRLKPNQSGQYADFPFVSVCGRELNFFKIAADSCPTPFVFHSLHASAAPSSHCLVYAGTRTIPFHPHLLRQTASGHLLHPVPDLSESSWPRLGQVGSDLAVRLGECIQGVDPRTGYPHLFWQGQRVPILPADD